MTEIIFVYSFLAVSFIVIGYITKQRIYNLLSIAPFLAIAIETGSTAIIISMIGMIIWQLYYTFWSEK